MRHHLRGILLVAAFIIALSPVAEARQPAGGRPIVLDLDASEVTRRILHTRLLVPAEPGPLALVYPKWIPGEHGPTGPVTDTAGLRIRAGGRDIAWRRDELDMYTIRCNVPAGVAELEVSLDFLSPPSNIEGFSSAASATQKLATINWNQVLLYPAGQPAHEILVRASLTLPPEWKLGTALPVASQSGQVTKFSPVSLETLVDSPVIAGLHFREVPLAPSEKPAHFIEMAADSPEALELTTQQKAAYDRLVRETGVLFGARHYESYRFLLALSDDVAHFGLEHHESSDNRMPEQGLTDADLRKSRSTLLPHEFVHSWNGKYRRPADLIIPDYQQPMKTSLLWVYEGLTQYLGLMLTARSGLWTPEEYRERLAMIAEWAGNESGRTWRPLLDTAVSAQLLFEAREDWEAWRRGTDFYDEAVLIWLDADTLIRRETQGRKSLDDFCRRFHGGESGRVSVVPYTFDEVVEGLGAVLVHDWRSFLAERLNSTSAAAPLAGLQRSGWRLSYAATPSGLQKAYEKEQKRTNLSASIGAVLMQNGMIADIIPGKAADRAGLGPGMKVLAINSRRWPEHFALAAQILRAAVAATHGGQVLELLVQNGQFIREHRIDYREGDKYPSLERIPGEEDLLSEIIRGRS